jgi:hypothetical protein
MIEAGLPTRDQLERASLIPAAEKRAALVAESFRQAELDTPARSRLVNVDDAKSDMVDPPEA